LHGASAGIRVPTSAALVISAVIGRVGQPVNMLIVLVGVVPIGIVVGDRPVVPIGKHPMYPPAIAIPVAGDIGAIGRLGAE
jgi:hypothetical protein